MPNPLFCRQIVSPNRQADRGWRLADMARDYGFVREAHMVLALMEEFASAAPIQPMAFLPGTERPSPVFLTGFTSGASSSFPGLAAGKQTLSPPIGTANPSFSAMPPAVISSDASTRATPASALQRARRYLPTMARPAHR